MDQVLHKNQQSESIIMVRNQWFILFHAFLMILKILFTFLANNCLNNSAVTDRHLDKSVVNSFFMAI